MLCVSLVLLYKHVCTLFEMRTKRLRKCILKTCLNRGDEVLLIAICRAFANHLNTAFTWYSPIQASIQPWLMEYNSNRGVWKGLILYRLEFTTHAFIDTHTKYVHLVIMFMWMWNVRDPSTTGSTGLGAAVNENKND